MSRRLRLALALALELVHLVASATLVRSILYDRWITVLASVLLLVGATAARRGKTWGVGVALASAAAFPTAWALGMAPGWFWLVGAVGALPFALTWRSLARFDAKATAFGASLAVAAGLSGAVGWRVFAPALITAVPALRPGFWPAHLVLAGLTTAALVLLGRASRQADAGGLTASDEPALAVAPPRATLGAAPNRVRVLDAPQAPGAADVAPLDADDAWADDSRLPPAACRLPPAARGGRV